MHTAFLGFLRGVAQACGQGSARDEEEERVLGREDRGQQCPGASREKVQLAGLLGQGGYWAPNLALHLTGLRRSLHSSVVRKAALGLGPCVCCFPRTGQTMKPPPPSSRQVPSPQLQPEAARWEFRPSSVCELGGNPAWVTHPLTPLECAEFQELKVLGVRPLQEAQRSGRPKGHCLTVCDG